jgi:hypothetical protein
MAVLKIEFGTLQILQNPGIFLEICDLERSFVLKSGNPEDIPGFRSK